MSFQIENYMHFYASLFLVFFIAIPNLVGSDDKYVLFQTETQEEESLKLLKTIRGNIRPKSIVHSGNGRFFAQNMMYRHSITVYDRNYTLLKTIKDEVRAKDFGISSTSEILKGSPVEVAFTSTGQYAYVSNYKMYGKGYNKPGQDNCSMSKDFDKSFVYKINTYSLEIESIIEVGSVPKFLAVSPNDKSLLVTNWCSGDLSVIDLQTEEEVRRIELGKYPRGIAIDSRSSFAYISIMGEDQIAVLNLLDYSMTWMPAHGQTPRHVVLDPTDRYLYISLSRDGEVAKIDLVKRELVKKVESGAETRSIVLGPDGRFLYTVNYEDNSISKVDTESMEVLETIDTHEKPVGITVDTETNFIWVACYTGSILVFEDLDYTTGKGPKDLNINVAAAGTNPRRNRTKSKKKGTSFYYVPRPGILKDPEYYVYRETPQKELDPVISKKAPLPKPLNAKPKKQLTEIKKDKEKIDLDKAIASSSITERARISSTSFHVIVGSYQNDKFAQTKAKELKKKGYDTEVLPNEQGGFRVSAGQYSAKDAASQAAEEFRKRMGIKAWVLKE